MSLAGLSCLRCGSEYPARLDAYLCPSCGLRQPGEDPGILEVSYDYRAAAQRWPEDLRENGPGLRRYRALLPPVEGLDALPVGATPLVSSATLAAELGLGDLWLKDETRNPTRCLKDRATAVAMALAKELGAEALYCSSQGNAAISLAAFCAHAGEACHVFVPAQLSPARHEWLRRFGAHVEPSEGDYDQAFYEAEALGQKRGWYSRNCALNPFLVEGKKTAALEIAEQLQWQAPDLVVCAVGDGCTLAALGKGFRELAEMGVIRQAPQLLGVQARGFAPIVHRLAGTPEAAPEDASTRAFSIAVRKPRNVLRLQREMDYSGGTLVAVSDEELVAAQRDLGRRSGVVVELSAAAPLAGLRGLARQQSLEGLRVALVLTGGRIDDEIGAA